MRIIAGVDRGRRLFAPPGRDTRPTADRVKEAMFSVLAAYLPGARVLDVFAGSGALSLEALSRGAQTAVLIDKNRKASAAIARNIALCNAQTQTQLLVGEATRLLAGLSGTFDLVFLDPPYQKGYIAQIEPYMPPLLATDAVVVLETAANEPERFTLPCWQLWKESKYGDAAVFYYQYQKEANCNG